MTKYTFSEWIEHDGSGMPVSANTLVYVTFGDNSTDENSYNGVQLEPGEAGFWRTLEDDNDYGNWVWDDEGTSGASIIAYKIATPAN